MLKEGFIGRGICLEFIHPWYQRIVTLSIADVCVHDLMDLLNTSRPTSSASNVSAQPQSPAPSGAWRKTRHSEAPPRH
jgi:hypothetical protein